MTNDATAVWPPDRKIVELGVISLTATEKDQVKEQKALLYNPLSLTPGIEASADPILAARPPAYAVSRHVHKVMMDLHATEFQSGVSAQRIIMIPGYVDNPSSLPCLVKNSRHNIAVTFGPKPAMLQARYVDDVADQIESFTLMLTQEI